MQNIFLHRASLYSWHGLKSVSYCSLIGSVFSFLVGQGVIVHLIINGILVTIKFSCCTSLMKLSISCYFILLVRYVTSNYIRGLAIIIIIVIIISSSSSSSSRSTSSCLSLIYNLISILGDFFLVWRLLFTKSRYLQVNNLLWY